MAFDDGTTEGVPHNIPTVRPPKNRKIWFLNGDLIRVEHSNRAAGIVTFWNMTQARQQSTTMLEFKRKRKRAYTVKETAKLLNFHHKTLPSMIKKGSIPPPMGALPGGERRWHHLSFYSEETIMETRALMAQTHQGRARKDGLITNNKTPSEQELRYRMGDGIMLFTQNEDGRFIPIFSETL